MNPREETRRWLRRYVVLGQLFSVYDAESLLRRAPRILFRPLRLFPLLSFFAWSSCRLTLLPLPLCSLFLLFLPPWLFLSLILLVSFSLFLLLSLSLFTLSLFYSVYLSSLGYSTIQPPADIKLHKQRDAPEGLFALQQIFSDSSRIAGAPYGVRCTRRACYATHY